MPHARSQFGSAGETLAAQYLADRGYDVIDRNVRTPVGELDLVCTRGRELVFVEVKTRRSLAQGHPEESVTPAKQQHLIRAAAWYRMTHAKYARAQYRIDVVAITQRDSADPEIVHIPSAVGE